MDARMALVPNDPDLFRIDGSDAVLLASRCPTCRREFFPRRWECPVDSAPLEDIELEREGVLHVATYVHVPAYGKAVMDADGYGVGQVDLPGGVRMQTILTGDPGSWKPGTVFRCVHAPIGQPRDGTQTVGFRFAPTEAGDA